MKYLAIALLVSSIASAQIGDASKGDYGYLKKEDQKYFQNDSFSGNNKQERIDANVKEINKLHGEIAALKAEMAALRAEVEKISRK